MPETPDEAQKDRSETQVTPGSVEDHFIRALAIGSTDQQQAYLDNECPDPETRKRVRALLEAYSDSGSFLEMPGVRPRRDEEAQDAGHSQTSHDGTAQEILGFLGQYQILSVLGQGGMGIVYRALDPHLNRVVAIKVMLPGFASNVQARRRFLREARAAASVSHPHIVTVHAVEPGSDSPEVTPPYLVMECIVGQSLQQKIDRTGPLAPTEIIRIARQLAAGLSAAHQQGLIHRDIKPANILLENGVERAKITDFGLARILDDITVTRTGEVSGSPSYMSPEQAQGDPLDHRSDLFSLGCVIYAMGTGHSPFRAQGVVHAIKRVTTEQPRPIRELNEDVPAELCRVVERLLQKDPSDRFQSATELLDALDSVRGTMMGLVEQNSIPPNVDPAIEPSDANINRPASPQQGVQKDDLAAIAQSRRDQSIVAMGNYLVYAGLFFVSLPVWLVLMGYLVQDGDPMETGGSTLFHGCMVGLAASALGWVVRHLIVPANVPLAKLKWWIPITMGCLLSVFSIAVHWWMEPSQDILPLRSVPEEIRPIVDVEHPSMNVRKVSINGAGSTTSRISESKTRIILDPEHLGTRVRISMVAEDGREFHRFHYPIEYAQRSLVTSDADWQPGSQVLVEVVDDSEEFKLRLVEFPKAEFANRILHLNEAPFHCLLDPAIEHQLVITCLPIDVEPSTNLDDYVRIKYRFTPEEGTSPKISLSSVLAAESAR